MSGNLKDLKSQLWQIRSTFDGAKQFIQKFKREKHEAQIETWLEMLEAAMKKLYTVRRKMDVLLEEADEKELSDSKEAPENREARLTMLAEKREAESASIILQTEDTYCELKGSLQLLLGQPTKNAANQEASASEQAVKSAFSRVKLPEIKLPTFGGRIREWVTFRDMFLSLIHRNVQLNEIDKFTYLRSSLVGEALQEIGTIEISAANYKIAWDLLQKRFENKKLIVEAHLDALFAVEPMKREGHDALNHLISEYDRNLQMLEKVGEDVSSWSTILVHMVCCRLDLTTLRNWESNHSSKEVPTYKELIEFLRNHCGVLQSIVPATAQLEARRPRNTVSHVQTSTQSSGRCPFCGDTMHSAYRCQRFLKMKVAERYDKVKRCGLCLNCFSSSHLVRFYTKGFCHHCKQKHHTLLHSGARSGDAASSSRNGSIVTNAQNRPPTTNTSQTHSQNQTTSSNTTTPSTNSLPIANTNMQFENHSPPTTHRTSINNANAFPANIYTPSRQVLLSTAVVQVVDSYGNAQFARALLDSGSEYCFITTNLYQKLKLAATASFLSVAEIGGSVVNSTKVVEALIVPRSPHISTYSETVKLHVLPKLTSVLPMQPVNIQTLAIPTNVTLADPRFYEPGPIDMIIGAECYYDLLIDGKIKLSQDGPTLQQTVFGWIVSGRVPGRHVEDTRTVSHACATADIRDLLAKFWELESCHSKSIFSVEESTCEDLFHRTTTRDPEGRYVVTLPKKQYVLRQLGESKSIATKRFLGLERRFQLNPELKVQYQDFRTS
ncbi:uncharacterized protein LOC128740101 [Sabethes cyaneus]|uniref:uncharacterized protein LOC128740101 n=1 Tax=Sabethes cyaneus TaxID=53552 RepID=UPI00237D7A94|nr:uncharacterized protein LOC128740101 [Sabethes cyaneus]